VNELVVIAEGETEQTFVRDVLSAHLSLHDISSWAVLPGKNRKRGGVKPWNTAFPDIIRTLKEQRFCTTMFDYYAMPADWPGRKDSEDQPWNLKATFVENAIEQFIKEQIGDSFNPVFFIPYVQLHEFEALVFSDTAILAEALLPMCQIPNIKRIKSDLDNVLNVAGHPEAINGGYETCPSRRLTRIVPAYRKPLVGPLVTGRIGIDLLRTKCTHFGEWLSKLENINQP